ncbi:helicase-related protein [Geodermatophilus poikilotrophus]|uniref:helicase-related protein n=1 Tax=Geodermatophilus poikilotrophus TaxID=1333667 RepID=UPI000A9A10DF|nr:helicase-related protein [Geodermatophilus poikilotrophus]
MRGTPPQRVVFHLGPTNSGKTHDALAALAEAGAGTYAAPLRQLAHEAYARLSAQLPPGTVGLSTGEEQIEPMAPVLCCTVEKAPPRGGLLVLDEAHWVTDPDRGHTWARLLLTGEYREVRVVSAAEALPVLEPLVADVADVEVVRHGRLSRLDVLPAPVRPSGVRPRTLVVAFSRKAVYATAAVLEAVRPGRTGVLYGALPPATRREVIDRFSRGELDVLVTTDVIGHGINVPAATVLFAETTKFDGVERRPLRTWRPRRSPAAPAATCSRVTARSACSPACRVCGRTPPWSPPAPRWPAARWPATCPGAPPGSAPSSTTWARSRRSTSPRPWAGGRGGPGRPPGTRR